MKDLAAELNYFRDRCERYESLLVRGALFEIEFVTAMIGHLFEIENRDQLSKFFSLIPKRIFEKLVDKLEELKNGGFQWVLPLVGGTGFEPVAFKKFTADLYDEVQAYLEHQRE